MSHGTSGGDNMSATPEPHAAAEPRLVEFAEGMRRNYRSRMPGAGSPDAVARVQTVGIPATHPDRTVRARLYVPRDTKSTELTPLVLFVHGGGFVAGDLDTHEVLACAIANRAGARVLSIEYRLAPEHPFPAGVDDVYASLQWVAANAAGLGADPRQIAIAGDSAGGNIATVTAMLARDRSGSHIAAQWLMYAALSNRMDTASWRDHGQNGFPTRELNAQFVACYVPEAMSPDAPLVAPLHARHENLPPALIQVGELDPLRDENVAYAEALKTARVEASAIVYAGERHGFMQFYKNAAQSASGSDAIDTGAAFLRSHI